MSIFVPTDSPQYAAATKEARKNEAHCIEVEQRMLGTLLCYNQTYAEVADILRPEHFIEDLHARLYESISFEIEQRGKCDALWIIAEFREDPTLEQLGGAEECIARLVAITDIPLSAKHHARVIFEYYQRRRIRAIAGEMYDRAKTAPMTDRSDIVAEAVHAFTTDEVVSDRAKQTRFDASELASSVAQRVSKAFQEGKPSETHPFCGSQELQRAIGGWKKGKLYVIGGRPSMGKSTVATSWLLRTAQKGHGVLLITLEMGGQEQIERCISDLCWSREFPVPYEAISREDLNQRQVEKVIAAEAQFNSLPLVIEEQTRPTLARVRAFVQQVSQRMAAKGQKLEVVAIDHLTLMDFGVKNDANLPQAIEMVTGGLKAMAKDLGIAVVLLCQLSRGLEGREDKRPTLADLRWSGGIEQDADVVLFVYREAYYLERRKETDPNKEMEREARLAECRYALEAIIAKQRGGACRTLDFFADMASAAIRDKEWRPHG